MTQFKSRCCGANSLMVAPTPHPVSYRTTSQLFPPPPLLIVCQGLVLLTTSDRKPALPPRIRGHILSFFSPFRADVSIFPKL